MRWKSKLLKESIEVTDGSLEGIEPLRKTEEGVVYGVKFYVNLAISKDEFRQIQLDTGTYIVPPCNFGTVKEFIKALEIDDYGQPGVEFKHIVEYLRQQPLRFMVHTAQTYWAGGKDRYERVVPYNIGETYSLAEFQSALDAIMVKYKKERLNEIIGFKERERRREKLPPLTTEEKRKIEKQVEDDIRREQAELYGIIFDKARELADIDPKTGKRKLASEPITGRDWKVNYGKPTSDANISKYLDTFINAINNKVINQVSTKLLGLAGYNYQKICSIDFSLMPETESSTTVDGMTEEQRMQVLKQNILGWIKESIQSYDRRIESSFGESYLMGLRGEVRLDFYNLLNKISDNAEDAKLVSTGDTYLKIIKTGISDINKLIARWHNVLKTSGKQNLLSSMVVEWWVGEEDIDGASYIPTTLLSDEVIARIKPQLEQLDINVDNTTIIAQLK